ncbi:hypothetical protein BHM03_00047164 [Ensete ventricosum]|nr:hypothetical protein BHM03_00047164 [Ensete ventricosum]
MEMAAVMAIALANGSGKPPDWQDFVGIIVLLVINSTISFIEENNAGNAAAALMAGLAPKAKILSLCNCKEDVKNKVHSVIDKYAERDQLAIAKETGRRLGMGTNMYPSSSLLGQNKDASMAALPVDELIEKADGFAGYEIVKKLQERKHICGMTGDGVNDAPALKKADIGIAVADATDAARGASDIVLTEPGLSVIISAVLTSRAIFQRMKNYTLGFMLIALIWKFDFSPFMVLIIAILNDGIGWGWAGVIWLYSIVFFFPLDCFKFAIRYILSGKAWDNLLENKTAFTTKKDYGREEREAQWAMAQRTRHGLQPPETANLFSDKNSYRELSEIAEQAKRRAEIARMHSQREKFRSQRPTKQGLVTKDKQLSPEHRNRLRAVVVPPRTKSRLQHKATARVSDLPADVPRSLHISQALTKNSRASICNTRTELNRDDTLAQ